MASHSNILVWKIPSTDEFGRLQSMGSQRLGSKIAGENAKWYSHFGQVFEFTKRLNIELLYGLAVLLLAIIQEK